MPVGNARSKCPRNQSFLAADARQQSIKKKTMVTRKAKFDIYQTVTDQILDLLEQGVKPWSASWQQSGTTFQIPQRHNGKYYKGINVILLWIAMEKFGFTSPTFMTFNQAIELGGRVKKGSKGFKVIFSQAAIIKDEAEEDTDAENRRWYTKTYTVFNTSQIEGLPDNYTVQPEAENPIENPDTRSVKLDAFFGSIRADVCTGRSPAYSPLGDYISMPEFEKFESATAYYSTMAHEFVHWTGNAKRLDRKIGGKFGDTDYAQEELCAELGAAFLGAHLGFFVEEREDHASYLQSWLKKLKNDKRYFMTAASQAQKAVDFLIERSTQSKEQQTLAA